MAALTHAPLPAIPDLITALWKPALLESGLSAPWRRPGDEAFWFSRSAWSFHAIAKWRQCLLQKTKVTVFLPDFFCNASLAPLRRIDAKLFFYPLTDQMAPDMDACRALAHGMPPDLFVLVHFFGQPAPAKNAADFCRSTGAWLIEDAAHVLRPIPGIGDNGDCVIYSPHKHLPIPDGAVLTIRQDGPAQLGAHASAIGILDDIYTSVLDSPGFRYGRPLIWMIKRVLQKLGLRSKRRIGSTFQADTHIAETDFTHPKMSQVAKRLLSVWLKRLDTVARLRHQHRMLWNQFFAQVDLVPHLMVPLLGECTPYLAAYACKDEIHAEEIFLRCQIAGLPVSTWPDLPPEVSIQPDCRRKALHLRNTRLYLPVHQTIDLRHIDSFVPRFLKEKDA